MMHIAKRRLQKPRITTSYYLTDSWPLKIISIDSTVHEKNERGIHFYGENKSEIGSVTCSAKTIVILVNLDSD